MICWQGCQDMKTLGVACRWAAHWTDAATGKQRSKSFSAAKYGMEQAKQMAIAERKRTEDNGEAKVREHQPPGSAELQSDVDGVNYNKGLERWAAAWIRLDGSRAFKSFSVNRYGHDEAKHLAEKARLDDEARGEVRMKQSSST